MAELISAKDLPITEAEEIDVLCVDNGELKRKQAKGLGGGAGGYVIRLPKSDFSVDESGTMSINITESYDNFAQILYDGGNVVIDASKALAEMMGTPEGAVVYLPLSGCIFIPGVGINSTCLMGDISITCSAYNGSWTPPVE